MEWPRTHKCRNSRERLCLSEVGRRSCSRVEAAPQPARRSLAEEQAIDLQTDGKAKPFRKAERQSRVAHGGLIIMIWDTIKSRLLPKSGGRTGSFLVPSVVLDLQPDFIAGARLDRKSRQVRRIAVRQIEPGALDPLAARPNLAKAEVVRRAIREVLETVGDRNDRLGVLLPDPTVRVAVLHFETLSNRRGEAEALVRWKMGSILPFPAEEARVSYQLLSKTEQSVEVLAMAVRNSVVAEYEAAFEDMGAGPALVLPATAALLPLLPTGYQGSKVLVHVCSGSVTSVVVVGDGISFWRNRQLEGDSGGGDGEVVREIERVVATCRDHLKSEIESLWIHIRPAADSSLDKEIGEATGQRVQRLTTSPALLEALAPEEKQFVERFGMPFAGLLANHN